jgi:hypothetical protein
MLATSLDIGAQAHEASRHSGAGASWPSFATLAQVGDWLAFPHDDALRL